LPIRLIHQSNDAHDTACPGAVVHPHPTANGVHMAIPLSRCPLSGVKRTSPERSSMSAYDPKPTSALALITTVY
jgi:hypothetical protein